MGGGIYWKGVFIRIHTVSDAWNLGSLTRCTYLCSFFCLNSNIWAMSWENLFIAYANNKGADQPAHPHSLISAYVVRCLGSMIPTLAKSKISGFELVSGPERTAWSLNMLQTPKTGFLVTWLIWHLQFVGWFHSACLTEGLSSWRSSEEWNLENRYFTPYMPSGLVYPY